MLLLVQKFLVLFYDHPPPSRAISRRRPGRRRPRGGRFRRCRAR
uniref:Uncharacterized protein n=1 Tax=Arundo donax TaxID=35708 RepID=A0A0A9FG98_ARUDO